MSKIGGRVVRIKINNIIDLDYAIKMTVGWYIKYAFYSSTVFMLYYGFDMGGIINDN